MTQFNTPEFEVIDAVTRRRRTVKVLADSPFPEKDLTSTISRLIATAGWAPFHKVCNADHRGAGQMAGVEPWRFHVLAAADCRNLRGKVLEMEGAGKIPAMLASADAMILATWLPNPSVAGESRVGSNGDQLFEPNLANVEHIAAASAAVQSFLLAATAAGFETYWSSGGVLRSAEIYQSLGIPGAQQLLAAIFLFPALLPEGCSAKVAESKLRSQRSEPADWSRWVKVPG